MQLESVTIPNHLTWQQFGCKSQAYFDQYIKGQRLPVLLVYGKFKLLEAADGQQWNVHQDDLIPDDEYRAMKVMEAVEFEFRKQQREQSKEAA